SLKPSILPLQQRAVKSDASEPGISDTPNSNQNYTPKALDPSTLLPLQQLTITSGAAEPGTAEAVTIESVDKDNHLQQPPQDRQPFTARYGTSPWEMNFDRNRRQSRILRLPDEMLLRIMKAAETDDLFMLRQVSFTFWRIYQGRDFSKFHRPGRYLFRFLLGRKAGFESDNKTVLRAKQLAFCNCCLQRRLSERYQFDRYDFQTRTTMYCSHCKCDHKKMLFSVQQRQSPPEVRRCIGSYGFFRLCPHLMVSTHSVWKKARKILSDDEHRIGPSLYKTVVLGRCSQCRDMALQDTRMRTPRDFISSPPTFSLTKPKWHDSLFMISCEWTLPFSTVPEGNTSIAAFLLQKHEEFKNRYGN
ncbi:hypothetical protein LY78DRAFT_558990, partial [Colletotrichum sublineola]